MLLFVTNVSFSAPPVIEEKKPREEPEKIKLWREEQKKRLEEKGKDFFI